MPEYSVTWTIDGIDADNPEDAARKAKAMRESADTTADVYNVAHFDESPIGPLDEDSVDIDLSALNGRSV